MPSLARRLGVSVWVPCLAVISGCPSVPETNQQACHRALTRIFGCDLEGVDNLELVEELVTPICSDVSDDTDDCDFFTLANCVAGLSCDELLGESPASWECVGLVTELDQACFLQE